MYSERQLHADRVAQLTQGDSGGGQGGILTWFKKNYVAPLADQLRTQLIDLNLPEDAVAQAFDQLVPTYAAPVPEDTSRLVPPPRLSQQEPFEKRAPQLGMPGSDWKDPAPRTPAQMRAMYCAPLLDQRAAAHKSERYYVECPSESILHELPLAGQTFDRFAWDSFTHYYDVTWEPCMLLREAGVEIMKNDFLQCLGQFDTYARDDGALFEEISVIYEDSNRQVITKKYTIKLPFDPTNGTGRPVYQGYGITLEDGSPLPAVVKYNLSWGKGMEEWRYLSILRLISSHLLIPPKMCSILTGKFVKLCKKNATPGAPALDVEAIYGDGPSAVPAVQVPTTEPKDRVTLVDPNRAQLPSISVPAIEAPKVAPGLETVRAGKNAKGGPSGSQQSLPPPPPSSVTRGRDTRERSPPPPPPAVPKGQRPAALTQRAWKDEPVVPKVVLPPSPTRPVPLPRDRENFILKLPEYLKLLNDAQTVELTQYLANDPQCGPLLDAASVTSPNEDEGYRNLVADRIDYMLSDEGRHHGALAEDLMDMD